MIFTKESIEKILNNTKQQTRRLVKKGEGANFAITKNNEKIIVEVENKKNKDWNLWRLKWMVGKDYSVQPGRGMPCVWYKNKKKCYCGKRHDIPLRIRITRIRKERLLKISPSDVEKEGFKNKDEFIRNFMKINWNKVSKEAKEITFKKLLEQEYRIRNYITANAWNPFVWALDISKLEVEA